MIENIHVAICINRYDEALIARDLFVAKNFEELDAITTQYEDSDELRKAYEEDISEFFIDNIPTIRKNETKNGKFRGRISAFYYDEKGCRHFVELSYKNKRIVRNYQMMNSAKECYAFFEEVFDKAVKEIQRKKSMFEGLQTVKDCVYSLCRVFERYGYHFSENEVYYLTCYFNEFNIERRKKLRSDCLKLLKDNIDAFFATRKKETVKRVPKKVSSPEKMEFEEPSDEWVLTCSIDAPYELKYDVERVKKTKDYSILLDNYDADVISMYTNYYDRGKKR